MDNVDHIILCVPAFQGGVQRIADSKSHVELWISGLTTMKWPYFSTRAALNAEIDVFVDRNAT